MPKVDKFGHAVKVIALCLPPVIMSLIGLATLSRKKGGTVVAGRKTRPTAKRTPRDSA